MNSFQAVASFPFANVDLGKAWFLQLPFISIEKLLEAYRKNTAALTGVNQVAFDGLKSLMERQGDLLKTSVDEYTKVTSDVLAAGSFEESAAKQAEAARYGYNSTIVRLRELGDIATRANVAAVDILDARITEAFDELKALFAAPVDSATATSAAPPVIGEPVAEAEETARGGHADGSVELEPTDTATPRTARSTAGPGTRTGRRPTSRG